MNFINGFVIFLVGLVTVVALLPVFGEIAGVLGNTMSSTVMVLVGAMVLLIVIGLIYNLVVDSAPNDVGGNSYG